MVDQRPFGYLYKTTIFTGRKVLVYVGKREQPRFTKAYLGSGAVLRKILREGKFKAVNVELVGYFYSKEELHAGEIALISETRSEWLGHCINIAPGGGGGKGTTWIFEECKRSALKFKTRTAWQNGEKGAYLSARNNGWLDECCEHMEFVQLPNGYWTIEKCHTEALKHKTKTDWQKKHPPSYQGAQRLGCIDICCGHMPIKKQPRGYWNLERCKEAAAQFKTRQEWCDAMPMPYRVALSAGWMDECCAHMPPPNKPHGYWSFDRCKDDALKFKTRSDWQMLSPGAYQAAHRKEWVDLCCAHMKQLRVPNGHWTLDNCKADALRFKTRKAWKTASSRGFVVASENGWLDECCAHMIVMRVPTWTLESCKADAAKYKTRSEWERNSGSACNAARRHGWIDICCAHMRRPTSIDNKQAA